MSAHTPAEFIARWKSSGGAEIANSQSFLKELCELLALPHPEPTQPDEDRNTYVFEKAVKIGNGDGTETDGRLDLYRKGHFVLESKQGTESREAETDEALATVSKAKKRRKGHADRGSSMWTLVMTRARKQAERYAQAIPGEWPPFLVVVDVGHCIQLYADFTQSGKNYQPFPDPTSFQIWLADLAQPEIRERLKAVWLDPLSSLDPSRISAKVTRKAPGADASGSGEPLTKKEQLIHEQGLVSVLKQIHDDLDAAVFAACGWPGTRDDEKILERLVALNHARAAEEAAGKVRWLARA